MEHNYSNNRPECRPYRSHKTPACSTCRHRKVRCQIDNQDLTCRYCRERRLPCDRGTGEKRFPPSQNQTAKRAPRARASGISGSQHPRTTAWTGTREGVEATHTPANSSSLIMNPTMGEDVDVVERHLMSQSVLGSRRLYTLISNSTGDPIVYRTVPRQRRGLHHTSGLAQREILDNIFTSMQAEMINL